MFCEKTVWIIGAGSDIAVSFLKQFSSHFGKLVLAGRNVRKLKAIRQKCHILNSEVFALDLCSPKSIQHFVQAAPAPDIIINFAGHIAYSGKREDTSANNILRTFGANATGFIMLAESVLPQMKGKNSGTILVLTSCAGERGKATNRIYSASKGAMSSYLQGLAQACEGSGVCVIDFKPGRVTTKMLRKAPLKNRLFAAKRESVADCVFRALQLQKSKVVYQAHWKLPMKLYRAIPAKLYNKLK